MDVSDEVAFARETVSKSLPSLTRPRLQTAREDRLEEIERQTAKCYAGMESLTKQLRDVASKLEDPIPEPIHDAITSQSWDKDEDSLVESVDGLKRAALTK